LYEENNFNFKEFFEDFFKKIINISQKVVTKAIIKQAGVACVIPFAPICHLCDP
jgi:hypothetical protein